MRDRRRWLWLALVGLVGCGGSGDDVRMLPTVPPEATTTTVVAGAAPSTVPGSTFAPSAPTTVGRPARDSSPAGGASRAGPVAAALAPAPPGTYRYDTSGTTTVGLTAAPYPAVTILVVDPPVGTRQHSTRDLRDPSGNGPVLELFLDYRSDGVFLEGLRLITSVAGFRDTRDLRPASPALLLATGAGTGARQELELGGARLVVEVQGQERLTIGGQAVDTLVVHLVATLAPGEVTGTLDMTAWLAPSVRLWVKERSATDATAGGGLFRLQSRYEATLQRLP